MEDNTKKIVLDALNAESPSEKSEGRPNNPVLPLVGSINVPITIEEEKDVE